MSCEFGVQPLTPSDENLPNVDFDALLAGQLLISLVGPFRYHPASCATRRLYHGTDLSGPRRERGLGVLDASSLPSHHLPSLKSSQK